MIAVATSAAAAAATAYSAVAASPQALMTVIFCRAATDAAAWPLPCP